MPTSTDEPSFTSEHGQLATSVMPFADSSPLSEAVGWASWLFSEQNILTSLEYSILISLKKKIRTSNLF